MTVQSTAQSRKSRKGDWHRLQDEVYRQMLRLEGRRPDAGLNLATAFLQAWVTSSSEPENLELREWLSKISLVCLPLIESAELDVADNAVCWR